MTEHLWRGNVAEFVIHILSLMYKDCGKLENGVKLGEQRRRKSIVGLVVLVDSI